MEGKLMKVVNTIVKILVALAAVAGAVYVIATYGESANANAPASASAAAQKKKLLWKKSPLRKLLLSKKALLSLTKLTSKANS